MGFWIGYDGGGCNIGGIGGICGNGERRPPPCGVDRSPPGLTVGEKVGWLVDVDMDWVELAWVSEEKSGLSAADGGSEELIIEGYLE